MSTNKGEGYDTRRECWAVRSLLGFLPQEQGFYPRLTVSETLRYLAALQGPYPLIPLIRLPASAHKEQQEHDTHTIDTDQPCAIYRSVAEATQLALCTTMGIPPCPLVDMATAYCSNWSIILVVGLLSQEWRRGTLVQLALRRALPKVLFERLGYVVLYLLALIIGTTLAACILTPHLPDNATILQIVWNVVITVLPPTLLLIAIVLLVTHQTVSIIAGYTVSAALWLANLLFSNSVANAGTPNALLSYLLFGWYDRVHTPAPDNWLIGKYILLVVVLVLLALQYRVLRQEARMIRNQED